jgi:dolichyl-phosphate-mannose--protein O-mannosyl transferase
VQQNTKLTLIRVGVLFGGLFYTWSGAALIAAPEWFFNTFGYFPPFNRHYAGDAGTFLLPLGIGLLLIARAPAKHIGLIAVAAGISVLHVFNHLYDDLLIGDMSHLLTDILPLLSVGIVLLLVLYALRSDLTAQSK